MKHPDPRLETITPKKLVGQRLRMSWAEDQSSALWRPFRAQRTTVPNRVGDLNYSIQGYGALMAAGTFTPTTPFDKWATVEVSDFSQIPDGMEPYELAGGLYAVFPYTGPAAGFPQVAQYIFGEWLPASGYRLDARDHFEIFADSYHPLDVNAREEIWLPVVAKS